MTSNRDLTRWEAAFVCAVVLAGLVLRVRLAMITFVNPDEAVHVNFALSTVPEILRYQFFDNHPPLLLLMMHAIARVSHSELAMRLVPVLSGSAFPVFVGLWLRRVAGKTAGLAALFILTFSPHFVSLSAEMRSYTLALALVSASLVALEIALDTGRLGAMLGFDVLLAAGILSDYSVAFFAGAAFVYAAMRIGRSPSAVRRAWLAGQAVALAVYGVLFVVDVRHAIRRGFASHARDTWLAPSFPHRGKLLTFPLVNMIGPFQYLMASRILGAVALAMFGVAVFLLWTGRTGMEREKSRALALLLTVPFGLAIIAAYAGAFPFGNTRHSMMIGLFSACGLAIFLEFLPRQARMAIPLVAAGLVPIWLWAADPEPNAILADRNRKSQLFASLDYMRAHVPAGTIVMSNRQTLDVLLYYVDGREPPPNPPGRFVATPIGAWRIAWREYGFVTVADYQSSLAAFRTQFGIAQNAPVWVMEGGFSPVTPVDENHPLVGALHVFQEP